MDMLFLNRNCTFTPAEKPLPRSFVTLDELPYRDLNVCLASTPIEVFNSWLNASAQIKEDNNKITIFFMVPILMVANVRVYDQLRC
jgi:hypothetical protein